MQNEAACGWHRLGLTWLSSAHKALTAGTHYGIDTTRRLPHTANQRMRFPLTHTHRHTPFTTDPWWNTSSPRTLSVQKCMSRTQTLSAPPIAMTKCASVSQWDVFSKQVPLRLSSFEDLHREDPKVAGVLNNLGKKRILKSTSAPCATL